MHEPISHALLLDLAKYDQDTGLWSWNKNRRFCSHGKRAGSITRYGYIKVSLLGKNYQAHRLAWFYMTGSWPKHEIDHINGVRDDNRFSNLREATPTQNQANKKMRKDNTSGFKGVCWDKSKGKWQSSLSIKGSTRFLGRFDTPEEAYKAFEAASIEVHGEYANPRGE